MKHKLKNILILFNVIILTFALSNTYGLAEEWAPVSSEEKKMSLEDKLKTKITIDYKNADILSVLRSFSWTYNLNIVTSPDIKGKVTISLRDITVEKALEAIITISGLTYSIRDDIIYISPGDVEAVELISEVVFLKYIKAADAQNMLRRTISTKGDLKISELANSLLVTDFPANIQRVKKLLKKIDIPPQQVLIEARIVDITSTDLKALGVTWEVQFDPTHGIFTGHHTPTEEHIDVGMNLKSPSDLALPAGYGQFKISAVSTEGLTATATIDALVRDGKANILASPSIAVLNGQEARIIIGERYPYIERGYTTAAGTVETTKFVDIGTTLRVTPQINEDGYITMRVHPEVSSLYGTVAAGPRITTREADTTVRIKEGETLIIGGLIKQKDETTVDRIPILGQIPIIGFLFSRESVDSEQKELAVFITPRILRSREEKERLLSKKEIEKEEVYVNIAKTGKLTLVEAIFKKARALDKGHGLESVRKTEGFRKAQALGLYEHIYYQFPDSFRAPEALYYGGMISYHYKKDYKKAKDLFAHLISDYPDSKFTKKAIRKYKKIEKIEKRKRRKKRR